MRVISVTCSENDTYTYFTLCQTSRVLCKQVSQLWDELHMRQPWRNALTGGNASSSLQAVALGADTPPKYLAVIAINTASSSIRLGIVFPSVKSPLDVWSSLLLSKCYFIRWKISFGVCCAQMLMLVLGARLPAQLTSIHDH